MNRRLLFGAPVVAALCAVAFLGLAASASAALPTYNNSFETDTAGWFDNGGTITREQSGSSYGGGYADPVASASGGYHARLGRGTCDTSDINPAGTAVNCTGPFTRWGGYNKTWTGGYTTQVDVYLDAEYAQANADSFGGNIACLTAADGPTNTECKGTRFDYTSAINNANGDHLRDFGFNVSTGLAKDDRVVLPACQGFTVTGQTDVNRVNANPNIDNYDPQCIAESGWYTFKHTFSDDGTGHLRVLMEIIPVGGSNPAASWTIDSGDPIASGDPSKDVGCNRYGWFSNQEIYGLPIDNASMTGCGTPPVPAGRISPTGTTCQQYAAGTAPVLGQVQYTTTRGGKINAVSPGVFFYYTKVSGAQGDDVEITQEHTGAAPAIPIQNGQVVLYNASTCKVLKWTGTANSDGTGELPSSGNFIIGVKYSPSSLKGLTAPNPATVTYSFGTELNSVEIPADAASVDLVKK
jgi:hypothetical protein